MRGFLVVGASVVAVLLGGVAIADGVLRERAEKEVAAGLSAQVPGVEQTPDVDIGGSPFLTQVGGGELDDVRVRSDVLDLGGIVLEDVDVQLNGVSTTEPFTAREALMTASVSLETISRLVDIDAELSIQDDELVATTSLLGLPLDFVLTPRAAGEVIEVDLERLSLAGATLSADDLPDQLVDQVRGLEVPIDGLPDGMELTDLTVTADGVDLRAEGSDVVLDMTALG